MAWAGASETVADGLRRFDAGKSESVLPRQLGMAGANGRWLARGGGMETADSSEDPIDLIVRSVPRHIWVTIGAILIMLLSSWLFFKPPTAPGSAGTSAESGSETLEGRVVEVVSEETISMDRHEQPVQQVVVEITRGSQRGRQVEIRHGETILIAEGSRVRRGDRVLVEYSNGPVGERFYISDFVRWPSLLLLVSLFAAATVLVGQWVGLRSLVSMGISVLAIAGFIIPGILSGHAPWPVCMAGALLMMTATLYLTYGWGPKTHTALAGLTISLLLTGLLATFAADWSHLTGLGSEDAAFLTQAAPTPIDLRGLLLGGILLGAVGVLDDVTIGQASATFELKRANPELSWRQLFRHSMAIGRDHIASMVNTLLLAYAGASLPLLLLIAVQTPSLMQTLSREFITEEIVRTLVGSLGLILAVPITSLIAGLVAHRK
ncbi:MAG: hypothetical protein CVU38_04835 [Chloroflexi bacterium HGW-Chloroflexi-1]|nr:MAG: hypothetical protein CVU38_04835 [Chloroflexi bacterium HGW-Chloroflexi-1]